MRRLEGPDLCPICHVYVVPATQLLLVYCLCFARTVSNMHAPANHACLSRQGDSRRTREDPAPTAANQLLAVRTELSRWRSCLAWQRHAAPNSQSWSRQRVVQYYRYTIGITAHVPEPISIFSATQPELALPTSRWSNVVNH